VKRELETIKQIKIKDPEWQHASLQLIKGHKFYTPTQIEERGATREKNEKELEKRLQK